MATTDQDELGWDPNHGRRPAIPPGLQDFGGRIRQLSTSRPFLAFVVVVAVVVGVYYLLIAAPLYVSETQLAVRGREQASQPSFITAIVSNDTSTQAAEVSAFIKSPQMLEALDKQLHLRQIYSKPRLDLLNHLDAHASREDFLDFYRRMVSVNVDQTTYIVTVQASSFDPKSAHDIAKAILEQTSAYVDRLSAGIRADTVKASEAELQKAEEAVRQSRLAMTTYRTSTGMVDPTATAAAAAGTITSLQGQVISAQAEIAGLSTYSTPDNPQIVQDRAKIAALQAQIAAEQKRLASTANSTSLAQRLYVYEGLTATNEYEEKRLAAALTAYDSSRALADQRDLFLVRVVEPSLPEDPSRPNRLLDFFEVLLVAVAAYGIVALAIAGVRDHQGV